MWWKVLLFTLHAVTMCQAENIHIGAVLSSMDNINTLRALVGRANTDMRVKAQGLTFNVTAQLMDSNPIRSALSVCDDIISQKVHVIVASHPPDSAQSPISVSYTCGYYGVPLIGIFARDSAFSDKVNLLNFV